MFCLVSLPLFLQVSLEDGGSAEFMGALLDITMVTEGMLGGQCVFTALLCLINC